MYETRRHEKLTILTFSALAALTPPSGHKLLRSLVLVDPVIMRPQSEHEKGVFDLAGAAIGRRARWASR